MYYTIFIYRRSNRLNYWRNRICYELYSADEGWHTWIYTCNRWYIHSCLYNLIFLSLVDFVSFIKHSCVHINVINDRYNSSSVISIRDSVSSTTKHFFRTKWTGQRDVCNSCDNKHSSILITDTCHCEISTLFLYRNEQTQYKSLMINFDLYKQIITDRFWSVQLDQ